MHQPPSFVGRVGERTDLAALLARSAAGRGALAVISGEPGIGKTALAAAATDDMANVVWARAHEDGSPPLWLWQQVVRRLGADLPVLDAAPTTGSGHDRFRRFDHIATTLRSAAAATPLVIVLDDLHWADPDSLALLDFVTTELGSTPLAIIATMRPGELTIPARADLIIELRGLSEADLAELIDRTAGTAVPAGVTAAAREHTGGNPFFVGEIARLLRTAGTVGDADSWRRVLPTGVREVLTRRFARLPQPSHLALGAAAVLGMDADITVLAALLDVERVAAFDLLAPAVAGRLIEETGDGRIVFAHALVREAALSELGAGHRAAMHARAADLLTTIGGRRAASAIASHHLAAGNRVEAATWSRHAGDEAFAAAMYADAAGWYERSLTAADEQSPALLIRYGEALSRCGRVAEATTTFMTASRAARRVDDVDALAQAALGVGSIGGGFEVRLLDSAQLALLAEALQRLPDVPSVARALLLARVSVASSLQAPQAERVALANAAVAMARQTGDAGALAASLAAWCDAHAGPRHNAERMSAAAEMLGAAVRAGDPELELLARRHLLVALMEHGDVAAASREIAEFDRLASALRAPHFSWYGRVVRGMLALLRGELDDAEQLGQEAAALGHSAASANAEMLADGALVPMIAKARGGVAWIAMMRTANAGHEEAVRGMNPTVLLSARHGPTIAEVRAELDKLGSLDDVAGPDDSLYLQVVTTLADAAAFVGDEARMREAHTRLAPYADLFVLDGMAAVCYGPVVATLAKLADAMGDHEGAGVLRGRAEAHLQRAGAPLLLAELRGAGAVTPPAPEGAPTTGEFRPDGETMAVRFRGEAARFAPTKGMHDLATLLARPGTEVHVFDLVGNGTAAGPMAHQRDLGPVLDATAKRAYELRIRDLTEEIENAEERGDDVRAALLDDERHRLLGQLAGALGLAGRARPQGSDVERARKAVGMRIADALRRIEHELPALGRHLRASVRTGTYCVYAPEDPTAWHTAPGPGGTTGVASR